MAHSEGFEPSTARFVATSKDKQNQQLNSDFGWLSKFAIALFYSVFLSLGGSLYSSIYSSLSAAAPFTDRKGAIPRRHSYCAKSERVAIVEMSEFGVRIILRKDRYIKTLCKFHFWNKNDF